MANPGASPKPKKQSQRQKSARRKEKNDRLERIRLLYISYEHYRDSLIQQHDFHMTVVAAHKSLDLIELAAKEMVRLLPPLQEMALAHTADSQDAARAFPSFEQEQALPEIAKGVKELSAKLEALPGEILSFYQLFGPFAQYIGEPDNNHSANMF